MEESIEILKTTVAELRTIISRQVGLPVGAFRLTTDDDRELYDQHTLWSYDLEIGLCTTYNNISIYLIFISWYIGT